MKKKKKRPLCLNSPRTLPLTFSNLCFDLLQYIRGTGSDHKKLIQDVIFRQNLAKKVLLNDFLYYLFLQHDFLSWVLICIMEADASQK